MDVSVEGILVGVLCSVIVLPFNLLWIFLFRYSRRSFRHRVRVYPVSEHPTESTELVSSSVLDQSLETVLILKSIGEKRRWFQTSLEIDDVHSGGDYTGASLLCHLSGEKIESSSDGTSLGYISGQGSDPPLPNASAGLVETCDFLAALAPNRKKTSLEFDKQSTYSVCVSTSSSEGRGPYRSGFSLPHVFVYVGWFGCLLTSAIAALFTIWYGVSFGWDLSIRWLQSLFFSLLESLLVSQPVMVLLFILYTAFKSRTSKEDEDADEGFEDLSTSALHEVHHGHVNRGFEEEITGVEDQLDPALALRRKQRHLKYLKPPSKSQLSEAREKCVRSKTLRDYTVELLVFIMFFVVTWVLIASVTSPDVYHLNQTIKKTFLRSDYPTQSPPGSVKDAWKGISAALQENSATSSYTPFTVLLRDSQSLVFGRTKITQYGNPLLMVCQEVSTHASSNQSICHAKCHEGEGTWMSVELNQTRAESTKQLKEIEDSQWINECIREIALNFAVYTPFLRAISAATLSVKASLVGKPECHLELNSFPAFFKSADYGYFVRICKLLFVGVFLYLLQHELFLALKMSTKYFTNFWRVFQLFTVVLSSLCIVLFIRWSVCLYALLREVESSSQSQVFYYAKLVSWSQETLQASYSLLLFLLVVRCVYLLRPFRLVMCLGRILASAAYPLLACTVLIFIFMMAFAHPGYLFFGHLHSAFKSFGEAFFLVSNFFRMEGMSRYQDPALDEYSVLISFYFGLFLVGFWVVMRGTTAAVLMHVMPDFKKRRRNLLSDLVEVFIRNQLQLLKEKTKRRQRRDSTSDEEEDDEDDEEEFEELEEDVGLPREHVLEEVEDQIEELTLRVETLFGPDPLFDCITESDDFLSCLSLEDSEDDVEYLYQADRPSLSSGSGYESDHSTMSAVKWQFSSSSSHDISDESSRYERQASARPVTFTLDEAEMHGLSGGFGPASRTAYLDVYPGYLSCSSCYEISRSNACVTDDSDTAVSCTEHRYEGFTRPARRGEFRDVKSSEHRRPGSNTNILRDIVMRDSELHDGVLRDYNLGDGDMRDRKTVTSERAGSQDLYSSSGHSLRTRTQPCNEPIRPKTMYGLTRAHSRRGPDALPDVSTISPRPSTSVEGSNGEAATNSSSDQEAGRGAKKSHARKAKGLFRSSAVSPCQEEQTLGRSPALPDRAAHRTNPGSADSGVQSAWCPDPGVSERPLKGLLGDIGMNSRLGTEIRNDTEDTPGPNTRG